ncbi:c-type cytochrome [Paraliomyxa miuraensis]|uniref:c-type cytochrome n=1 Tax=Paraliomyxa miuraensis TaxID=376150 RepID=UPI002254A6A5|nr:hypothetical protein [Paraliomyxa miuraensis]MCX4242972.1 hypothetical protein [Paraliomyxa miuraensis]
MACSDGPTVGGGGSGGSSATGGSDEAVDSTAAGMDSTGAGDSETGGDAPPQSCIDPAGPWSQGYSIPRQEPLPGDPVIGLETLLTEDYVSCGIPWELFPIAQPLLGTFADGPSLGWREGKNALVPVGWNVLELQDGSELVAPNCFNCHSAEFNGELVLGLGRHDADFTSDLYSLMQLVPPLPAFTDAGEAFNKFIQRYAVAGPASIMLTTGTNPAIEFAFILLSHRDPYTLEWLDEPIQELPDDMMIPSDPPPWWHARKKASQFANGMSRGDHRGTMILASSLCTDTVAEAAVILDYFVDVVAYLESIEPPQYPYPIDAELATAGAEVFECHCEGCHGSYDANDEHEFYPNMLIPLDLIGTDPVFAAYGAGEFNYLEEWFESSFFGTVTELGVTEPFVGYVAPPLDSVWASAPYFHNASVPTLDLVLDSNARPTYWKRVDFDSTNYDWDALGWPYEELDHGQDQAGPLEPRNLIYDTTKPGHGNGGHDFGDVLTPQERAAVLEYLKTI